jgi:hypothetical protein
MSLLFEKQYRKRLHVTRLPCPCGEEFSLIIPNVSRHGPPTSSPVQVNLIVSLPQFGNIHPITNGLVMSGSGGNPGATYYLLTSTNAARPLTNWTRLLTNQFDAGGNFSVTNPPATNRQSFYRLQLQ